MDYRDDVRAGVYVRISYVKRKDGQVDTLGVDRQEPPCRAKVERLDGTVVDTYVDNDLSAWNGKRRPAYERMLADLRAGRIDTLVAWQADRFVRTMREAVPLLDTAAATGARLLTVTGDYDLDTAAGRFNFRNMANMAEMESDLKSERLMAKHAQKAQAGTHHGGGVRPFGYTDDFETVHQEEAALIREAATRILDHREPVAVVLADWKTRGIVTTRGHPFKSTPLRTMLCSPRIAGLRQHRGSTNVVGPATWPAIIDATTRNRLLAFYAGRTGTAAHKVGRPPMKLYSGLLVCGRCGRKLYSFNKGNGVQVYFCPKGSDHDGCALSVNAADLEAVMNEAVLQWVCGPAFAKRLRAARQAVLAEGDRAAATLNADLAELADHERLPARFATDQTRARQAELQGRVQAAQAALTAAPITAILADLPTAKRALRAAWAAWTDDERRVRLAAVLDHVTVGPGVPGHFNPDRIVPHWR